MSAASVVRAEAAALLAAVVLLVMGLTAAPVILVGAIAATVLVSVRVGHRSLARWAGVAVGYAARPKTRVVATRRPRGHRRRRMHSTPPSDTLTAVLPGAVLVGARDRDGLGFGLIAWRDFLTVVVAVDAPDDPLVDLSRPVRVPLPDLAALLARAELGLHSVQVVSEAWPVRPLAGVSQLGTAVACRRTFVAVRARVEDNAAVGARGGGGLGATRLMAAAAKRAQLSLAEAGTRAHPLTTAELRTALASMSGLDRDPPVLREQWSDVTSSAVRHRAFAVGVEDLATGAVDAMVAAGAERVTTGVVLDGSDPRCTVRLTATGREEIEAATDQLSASAVRVGWRLRTLSGTQLFGLRATLPIGGIEC